jgi:hypothetical protein
MRYFGRSSRRAASWLAAGVLAACGEPPVAPPVPVGLALTASDTIRAAGGTVTFTAMAVDSQGTPVSGVAVAWSVRPPSRGQITSGGLFTAGPDSGLAYVRASVVEPALAESVAVRVVAPGTVKWTWAATEAGGVMPALGGPAVAPDGTVYVLVNTGGFPDYPVTLVALDPGGAVGWMRPLLEVRNATGPVVVPGTNRLWMVGAAAYLLDASGTVIWDTLTSAAVPDFSSGAATDQLLVGAYGLRVMVRDAATLAQLWQSQEAPLESWLVPPTLTADGRLLVKRSEDTLFVFRAQDGQLLRYFLDPDTLVDKRVFGVGTVPVGGRYYLPTANRLASYDTSGPLLWLTGATGLGVTEPAVAPDGTLFVQDRTWGVRALNPDGTNQWFRRTPNNGFGWREAARWSWHGGPALAQGGILYFAGQGGFFAHTTDGQPLWEFVADSADNWQPFLGAPAIAPDGTVYTFTSTHVYAFWGPAPPEPNSPWPMWRHDAQRTGWAR